MRRIAAVVCIALMASALPSSALDIVKDGKAVAVIVTPEKPDAVSTEAARLLQKYVMDCTGAELPVATEAAMPGGTRLFVGPTAAAKALGLDTAALVGDSYFMRVKDGALYLIGRDADVENVRAWQGARGTMRAVFDFLRDRAGVRWILPCPMGTWTPQAKDLSAPDDLKVDYVPPLLYLTGDQAIAPGKSDRFYPWSLANGERTAVRLFTAGGHSWCYAFPNLEDLRAQSDSKDKEARIDAAIAEFAKANPEAFALAGGRRLNRPEDYGGTKNLSEEYGPYLCTSHPDFVPSLTKWIQQKFNEGYDIVQLGQSDAMPPSKMCHCERCNREFGVLLEEPWPRDLPPNATDAQIARAKIVEAQSTEAIGKRIYVPHKAVIENCLKSHPDKVVMLLVYGRMSRYLVGEKDYGMRFPPNAIAESTSAAPEKLDALKRAFPSENVFGHWWGATLYNYWWSTYHGGLAPKQTPESIAVQQLRVLKYKILGNYFCGSLENFPAEGPCYYVCLRIMEQPHLKPQELLKEYCAGLYGKAAPKMVEYYNSLYQKVRSDPVQGTAALNLYGEDAATRHRMKYLTCWPPDKLAQLDGLLKKAEEQAGDDLRAVGFIQLARIGYEQIYFTEVAYREYDAYEKKPTPEGKAKVQAALDARQAWIKRVRGLEETAPEFVRDFFPSYAGTGYWYDFSDMLEDEGCKQSPLGKPFQGWEGAGEKPAGTGGGK